MTEDEFFMSDCGVSHTNWMAIGDKLCSTAVQLGYGCGEREVAPKDDDGMRLVPAGIQR